MSRHEAAVPVQRAACCAVAVWNMPTWRPPAAPKQKDWVAPAGWRFTIEAFVPDQKTALWVAPLAMVPPCLPPVAAVPSDELVVSGCKTTGVQSAEAPAARMSSRGARSLSLFMRFLVGGARGG